MPTKTGPTGWIRDDDAVGKVRTAIGAVPDTRVVAAGESLTGFARRQIERGNHGVFPHLAELSFFGRFLNPYAQRRGVCVGCGTARAIQDSWLYAIAQRGVYGRPAHVDVASIYAGSRTQADLGNGRWREDGSVGAWAAKWVHDHGAIEQGEHGQYDLTGLNEDLAVKWGKPGGKVPDAIIRLGASIRIDCFFCDTAEKMLDAAYAGYAMAWCDEYTFGPKNKQGISRLSEPAAHCTEVFCGAVSTGGSELIGGQQSWGNNLPGGTRTLTYRDGQVPMRPGMCFVPLEDFDKGLRQRGAECWAFQVEEGWR